MEEEIVEFNGQIKKSKLGQLQVSINNLGGQFTVPKQLKFEDLVLAEVEKDNFQCLVCSKMIKRKCHAITHFKKFHTDQVKTNNLLYKKYVTYSKLSIKRTGRLSTYLAMYLDDLVLY